MTENRQAHPSIKTFFLVIALESLLVFIWLALHPSDPQSRRILLYSLPRFSEMAVVALVTGLSIQGVRKSSDSAWSKKLVRQFSKKNLDNNFLYVGFLLMISAHFGLVLLQVFSEGVDLRHLNGYANSLLPLFFLFSLIGFEIILWTSFINKKHVFYSHWRLRKKIDYFVALLWHITSISLIFSILLQNSEKKSTTYLPVLGWQIFIVWTLLTLSILILKSKKITGISKHRRERLFVAILIGATAFTFISMLQSISRPLAKDNFYFQKWSSEDIMQTVSLEDLQKYPLETLNNIHIKPPGFDAIRAAFVNMWAAEEKLTSLLHVDFLLYKLWSLLYSLLGIILFLWVSKLTNIRIAAGASLIFLLHPASILYATLLDSTFLTVFLISLFYYLLWEVKEKDETLVLWLIPIVLALFFTRAIFQFPFLLITALSLSTFRVKRQNLLIFFFVTGSLIGLYSLKQYNKFGSFSTSSFTGLNINRSVGNLDIESYWGVDLTLDEQKEISLPSTLTRTRKVNGQTNFNHINYIEFNQHLMDEFKEYIRSTPISKIIISYWENLQIYFKPSSKYSQNIIVEHIPWRTAYETVFSAPVLPILLIILGISYLVKLNKKNYLQTIGLVLPGLYIFAATVLFEKGENMRFKFFIETLLFIFVTVQLYEIVRSAIQKSKKHRRIAPQSKR